MNTYYVYYESPTVLSVSTEGIEAQLPPNTNTYRVKANSEDAAINLALADGFAYQSPEDMAIIKSRVKVLLNS